MLVLAGVCVWIVVSRGCGKSGRSVHSRKVSLSILKGKVSLQSPNLIDYRSCVGRRASRSCGSPNSNIQIFEVTPPPGFQAWKRFAANNHASDRAFSAPLFPSARSVRDQLALPESSQFERSFPMVPHKDLRNVHGDNFREAWPRRNRLCGVDFGWVKAPCRGRHATRE